MLNIVVSKRLNTPGTGWTPPKQTRKPQIEGLKLHTPHQTGDVIWKLFNELLFTINFEAGKGVLIFVVGVVATNCCLEWQKY